MCEFNYSPNAKQITILRMTEFPYNLFLKDDVNAITQCYIHFIQKEAAGISSIKSSLYERA